MIPRKPMILKRPATPGTYNGDGVYIPAANAADETIYASVQPIGDELERLPEGRREKSAYKIFTDTLLRTAKEKNADVLEYKGIQYQVHLIEPWQNDIINHYKALIMEIESK